MRRGSGPVAAARASESASLAYALAFAIGLASLHALVPPGYFAGNRGEFAWPRGDSPTFVAGAYAFVDDGWRFPLFETRRLMHPTGANIIFTDSVPVAGLVAKIANRLTGLRFNYLGVWFGVVWVGQALAAVFFVRQMGVRSVAWCLIAAVLALGTPAFLARHGHLALSAHFVPLLALGLYARTVRSEPSRGTWVAWLALIGGSIWIHAYHVVMVGAVFGAALVDAWRAGRARPLRLALVGALAMTCVVAFAWVGGYFGYATGGGGYGHYSMNALSPFVPQHSGFFGGAVLDATGGQYEGLNYLGLGALGLVALAVALAPRATGQLLRRHAGLVATGLVLAAFAVSHRVFVGRHEVLTLPANPGWSVLAALRSSGRFFWPVGYALVLGALGVAARRGSTRWPLAVMLGGAMLAVVQAIDVGPYWTGLRQQIADGAPPTRKERAIRNLVRAHQRVLVFPPDLRCGGGSEALQFVGAISFYAAEAGVPVNAAYLARQKGQPDCDGDRRRLAELRLTPGDLLVAIVPPADPATVVAAAAQGGCRGDLSLAITESQWVVACTASAELLDAAHFDGPRTCADVALGTAGLDAYDGEGLSSTEGWGRWTDGPVARIRCRLPDDLPRPRHILLEGHGYAPGGVQEVAVTVNGRDAGTHSFPHGASTTIRLDLPADAGPDLVLGLAIARPSSPRENGESADGRRLGLGLVRLRVE